MSPLDLVRLTALMELSSGKPEIIIGLIDGPVLTTHADLVHENIRESSGRLSASCAKANSAACTHGTFVAGILCAKRNSSAPAICPNCTLLVHPIFGETIPKNGELPSAKPGELAEAIIECIGAGAKIINLSAALAQPSSKGELELEEALNYAAKRGVLVVAAAGNQGIVGSSAITRHVWVIPVVACDLLGRPMGESNLGNSIGRRGLSAPGNMITSLGISGEPVAFGGTSAAAPFVTGSMALLWSEFPAATAAELRFALTRAHRPSRVTVVPPLLDASAAQQFLASKLR